MSTQCVYFLLSSLSICRFTTLFIIQVAHHHHHIPVPVYSPAHHSSVGEYPAPYGYDSSGPGGPYLHSRTDSPIGETMPDLASWGIGEYPSAWDDPKITRSPETTLLKYNNYQGQQPQQQVGLPSSAGVNIGLHNFVTYVRNGTSNILFNILIF